MRHLLLGLLLHLWVEPGRCLEDANFTFDADVHHFAVATNSVYVATELKMYQLNRDLTLIHSLSQRGALESGDKEAALFHRVSDSDVRNATFHVNILVPFVENETLISCGVTLCGYCEVRDLANISKLIHKENFPVGPMVLSSASLGFLVNVKSTGTETYILTAIQQYADTSKKGSCSSDSKAVNLQNTRNEQSGGIFSLSGSSSTLMIKHEGDAEFVDGFQINSIIYLFANVHSGISGTQVRLIWLEGKTSKSDTLKSLRGATLHPFDGAEAPKRGKLLASSVIPGGPPVLWSGVFSTDEGLTNTELIVFDISPDLSRKTDADPDFSVEPDAVEPKAKDLWPKVVLSRQSSMTSVLVVRQKAWMVFFIGTGEGQLIKLAVDKAYQTLCPRVIYKASDDRQVFPKMHLDEVDRKHVYVVLRSQMIRVPVSRCSTQETMQACWSAQDPYCGWCSLKRSCTFEDECPDSVWLSIPEGSYQQKMVSHRVERGSNGNITLHVQTHLSVGRPELLSNITCQFSTSAGELCITRDSDPRSKQCTCILPISTRLTGELDVTVRINLGKEQLQEELKLTNCSAIQGPQSSSLCRQCVTAGCGWNNDSCSWATTGAVNDRVCNMLEPAGNFATPEISFINPNVVSFYGRNNVTLNGRNLGKVNRVRIQADINCSPQESPVWNNTGTHLTFHIPSADKGLFKVCVVLPDGSCHGNATITYRSSPSCTSIMPSSTWVSGKRPITVVGTHLEFVEEVTDSHAHIIPLRTVGLANLTYETPPAENIHKTLIHLKVGNVSLPCPSSFLYHPDPVFSSFTYTRNGDHLRVTIQKDADKLEMSAAELNIWGFHEGTFHYCIMTSIDTSNGTDSVICEIQNSPTAEIQRLKIKYGDRTILLETEANQPYKYLYIFLPVLLVVIIAMAFIILLIYRSQQRKLTARMNARLENLELDIRNDIRQGFVDLQMESADLLENVGAIPFLDYKHFASRIFFPENEALMVSCLKDIGQKVEPDEFCQAFSKLIQDQVFLTSMVHALEEQKSFTIKDKCTVASLLTVALHSNLPYLTDVMEYLLKHLMQQNSNMQSKLLLRHTASTVEKLLTNWMSICLYGFLRESVGQHLFLMVSALTQQIAKGPVDCVTEKALYTLSEDWLLWQAPDFSSLKLQVRFAAGSDGEVSEPLEVNALSCDTVEQVKEKILSTFKAKFGFSYNAPVRDVCIEFEKDGRFVPLQEVDASSEVVGEVTMLNTLKHYKVVDGASVKLLSKKTHPPLSPQGSVKDDQDFSGKYFHLIDPDVDEDQRQNPERKKLKLKEVHLTKLLSTKVAVHSYVENLFRSVWGRQHCKAPHAIKYFFDFLDTQADNLKISDPDVLHIWKTNSLLLRFWINILKNPQFVFDMEKLPHLDGCLSVIAQAFMDSFSLSENQLGKYAPTNKLLYAKDIPKYKQEVKAYYKQIREQPQITHSEFRGFLLEESKKHDNEFNEETALRELFKFIQQYFTVIKQKLEKNGAPIELMEQLQHVKNQFGGLKTCVWN
ncbi:plexin-C1 isoform X2 [Genypterus blacodes]|uniref:plexin-C1 isoform X2 n=1 Tax=Genypterus blacodes TaxID=154954 RepID=UPI003F75F824